VVSSSWGGSVAIPRITMSQGTTRIFLPNGTLYLPGDDSDDEEKNPHEKGEQTFARVFTNDLAYNEILKEKPVFPPGAMIVREKLLKETDETPQLVTVMLKHEKGFSPKSSDWEFFVLDARLAKIKKNESAGSCSKCHAQAGETDFVFKTYLK
jgi:hypothetical protein